MTIIEMSYLDFLLWTCIVSCTRFYPICCSFRDPNAIFCNLYSNLPRLLSSNEAAREISHQNIIHGQDGNVPRKRKRWESQFERRTNRRVEEYTRAGLFNEARFMELPTEDQVKGCYRDFYITTHPSHLVDEVCGAARYIGPWKPMTRLGRKTERGMDTGAGVES
jgi:hypothetical protein